MDNPESLQETIMPFEELIKGLNLKTHAGYEALRVALECVQLLDRKQQDYGSRNISQHGIFGVVVRLTDKFERMNHIMTKKRGQALNESLRDTFKDIANYAIIALLLDAGKWPNE